MCLERGSKMEKWEVENIKNYLERVKQVDIEKGNPDADEITKHWYWLMERAEQLAEAMHEGQYDKVGEPYIKHIRAVADKVKTYDQKTVAYLHDIVEDTSMDLENLRMLGFTEEIIQAVDAITRREDEDYFDFIDRVKENELARVVKLADLEHNMDDSRMENVSESLRKHYQSLKKKYQKAMKILYENPRQTRESF